MFLISLFVLLAISVCICICLCLYLTDADTHSQAYISYAASYAAQIARLDLHKFYINWNLNFNTLFLYCVYFFYSNNLQVIAQIYTKSESDLNWAIY